MTDYLALLGRFQGTHAIGERDETFVTFAADDPEGFTDAQVALLRRLTPHIVGALRGGIARGNEPRTSLYLGLHVGSAFYGNIGSAERLDFTAVAPSVNETNRIASMCKPLESDLLISAEFARAAPHQAHRLAALGRFALCGVRQPQMLYSLDPALADNAGAFRAP